MIGTRSFLIWRWKHVNEVSDFSHDTSASHFQCLLARLAGALTPLFSAVLRLDERQNTACYL
jgi:hypothetical protein